MKFLAILPLLALLSGLEAAAQPFLQRYENMYVLLLRGRAATLEGVALLEGLDSRFDGLGGVYEWEGSSQAATNSNRTVVQIPGVDPGRWFAISAADIVGGGLSASDFDGTYFKKSPLPLSLLGSLTNWAKLSTNTPVGRDLRGMDIAQSSYPSASDFYITNSVLINLPSGSNDLFTVPAGMRMALYTGALLVTNANSVYAQVKTNGTYYRLGAATTPSTSSGSALATVGLVFEQGETLAVSATNTVAAVNLQMIVFANTFPWYSPRILSMASGDNTVYVVPNGVHAFPVVTAFSFTAGPQLNYVNDSGSPTHINTFLVPTGYSTATIPRAGSNTVATATAGGTSFLGRMLSPGDKIVVNTDSSTATQLSWISILER